MARRPDPSEFDKPLTPADLKKHAEQLSRLSYSSVVEEYRRAHESAQWKGDVLPKAAAVQHMVSAWKQLWKWRKKRDPGRG